MRDAPFFTLNSIGSGGTISGSEEGGEDDQRASEDAIRSLVISYKLLGTKEFFIIHHTDCGMALFDQPTMERLLASSLKTASPGPDGWTDPGGEDGSDKGKVLAGLQVPPGDEAADELELFLAELGYAYVEETHNSVYRHFMR